MNDDLEQRLQHLGSRPASSLDRATVAAIEARVLRSVVPRRRALVPLLAAAAAVLLVAGAVFAFRSDRRDSLQPSDTSPLVTLTASTVTSTTLGGPTTSATPATTSPVTSPPVTTAVAPVAVTAPEATPAPPSVPSTVAATAPVTAPATAPPSSPPSAPTTVAPAPSQPVPPASFVLSVRRVDDRLLFDWPRYEGPAGQRYVLVRVGPAGLTEWPPAPVRIAATVNRIGVTFTSLDLPGAEPRRWVLAVLGANRELLAVSSPVTSN